MALSREGLGSGENPTAPAFGLGRGCSPTTSLRLASVALSLGISAIYFEKPSSVRNSRDAKDASGVETPAGQPASPLSCLFGVRPWRG